MTVTHYIPGMRGRNVVKGVAVAAGVVLLGSSCGDDDSSADTLAPIGSESNGSPITVGTVGPSAPSDDTTVDPAEAGSGYVSVRVRVQAAGIDESISLDRATVRADDLDPISLDAACTALDGGEGVAVSVVDLRRLASGARLVSAALRTDGASTAAGSYEGTVELGGADQVTTSYTGTIAIEEGGAAGTFEATDGSGNVATGDFVCAPQPVVPATTPPGDGGEEIPDSVPPSTT
jgi:hypothetical protein